MDPNQPPQPTPEGGQPNQPPPGYTPPAYPPPPGYPPPQGALPGYPPNYGQGYPPPMYMAPPVYVPPAAYHVPPSNGRPPEFVPAAEGSVVQAWISVATKPSRQNYVAWAQRVTPQWVTQSILAAAGLLVVTAIIVAVLVHTIFQSIISAIQANPNYITSSTAIQNATNALTGYSIFLVFAVIVSYVAQVFAIPFGQAVFMSPSLGSLGQRFQRALRPWVLAQVGLQALGVILVAIVALILTNILLPGLHAVIATAAPDGTASDAATQSAVGSFLGTFGLLFLLSIPASIYSIVMQVCWGSHEPLGGVWD